MAIFLFQVFTYTMPVFVVVVVVFFLFLFFVFPLFSRKLLIFVHGPSVHLTAHFFGRIYLFKSSRTELCLFQGKFFHSLR